MRLGTRKSPMAMIQSQHVADLITERTGRAVELVGITTFGDVSRANLAQIGGTGVFVSGLRASLLAGDIDLAVHSLKDLPVAQPDGIEMAAVPGRDDPRDALAARDGAKLADLPPGAKIGTGSPRRAAQLLLLRPDVVPVPVRGNAGTRLARVTSGEVDAVLLAYAGLARLGRLDAVTQVFEPDEMLPAPGQGALAVECRSDQPGLAALLARADDAATRAATTAERS
ncbi:MAG TPA: hydroxymethylbilane synthase, partial [Streptosporangiaceae bacterium]|nr:hydroxymethylbilane synthase [Streptosporangiaceae bacterium]